MKLTVDHERCIKAGECYTNQPQLFKATPNGLPEVINERPEGPDVEAAETAAYACPGRAIFVEKDKP